MWLPALIPLRRRRAADYHHPYKSIVSVGFEPANHGSNGKHANHYTTEATLFILLPQREQASVSGVNVYIGSEITRGKKGERNISLLL
jgi:hypothetical protein